jgi:hypothetical protein
MQDNTIGAGQDDGWNSEKAVLGDLSCSKVSHLMGAYFAAFRMFKNAHASSPLECVKAYRTTLDHVIKAAEHFDDVKKRDEALNMCLASSGMAAATVSGVAEPYDLANIAENAIQAVHGLFEQKGPNAINGDVKFGIKAGAVPGSMSVGVVVIPSNPAGEPPSNPENN